MIEPPGDGNTAVMPERPSTADYEAISDFAQAALEAVGGVDPDRLEQVRNLFADGLLQLGSTRLAADVVTRMAVGDKPDDPLAPVPSLVAVTDAPWTVAEYAMANLACRAAITVVDLCAALLYRLRATSSQTSATVREKDLGDWDRDRKDKRRWPVTAAEAQWLDDVLEHQGYRTLRDRFRDPFTHRQTDRVRLRLAIGYHPFTHIETLELWPRHGLPITSLHDAVIGSNAFAHDRFVTFCELVVQEWG